MAPTHCLSRVLPLPVPADPKLAYIAGKVHAPLVVKNILACETARRAGKARPASLKVHTPPAPNAPGVGLIPTGRTGGAAQLGTMIMGNWFTRTMKAGDMFIGGFNKDMGYPRPGVYPDAPTPASEAFVKAAPTTTAAPTTGGGGAAVTPAATAL